MTHDAYDRDDRRILVVDDDELTRSVVARRLRQWGYDPVVFGNPREALQYLKDAPCSVLLTDMSMPETSGLALARAVRRRSPRMPIVLMTGNPDPNLHRRAREHGIGEVVIKKAGPQDELRAAVPCVVLGSPVPGRSRPRRPVRRVTPISPTRFARR